MRKIVFGILVVFLVGLGFNKMGILKQVQDDNLGVQDDSLGVQDDSNTNKPVVKIGVVMPLTGPLAEEGVNNKIAMQVAIEEHRNDNIDFEFIFEDSAFNPAKTATIVRKLIDTDKVNAIISWAGTSGKVISPITEKEKILHIGITNNKEVAIGEYNFTYFTSTESKTAKLLEIVKKHKVKKMAVFAINQIGIQYNTNAVEKALKDNGIEVVRQNFNSDLRDFSLMIDKAKNEGFDMWYLSALPPSLDIFLKTYKEKGVEVPLTSADSLSITEHKSLIEGFEYVADSDGKKDIVDKIRERCQSDNLYLTGFSYDLIHIVTKLYDDFYSKTGKLATSEDLAAELMRLDYDGAVGKLKVLNDGEIESQAVIKKIVDGREITVED